MPADLERVAELAPQFQLLEQCRRAIDLAVDTCKAAKLQADRLPWSFGAGVQKAFYDLVETVERYADRVRSELPAVDPISDRDAQRVALVCAQAENALNFVENEANQAQGFLSAFRDGLTYIITGTTAAVAEGIFQSAVALSPLLIAVGIGLGLYILARSVST